MRSKYIVLFTVIALVAGAGELAAQMGTGRVAGTVKDTAGNAIEGANVVAQMGGTDFTLDATSDDRGRWAMIGFRKGDYSFTVTAKGFVPQQFTTSVKGLGKNPSVEVVLEPVTAGNAFNAGPAGELLTEGLALYEAKDYEGAIAKYEQILQEVPDLYQVRLNIGNCYVDMGELDKALAQYEMILAEEPTHTGALVSAGDVMVRKQDLDKAVEYFEKAIEQAPEDEVLPFNVAEIYFNQGDVNKAIEYYNRSATVKPDWPEPYLKVAYAYLNLAQMDQAAEAFKKVVEVAPDSPQAQMAQAALDSLQQ